MVHIVMQTDTSNTLHALGFLKMGVSDLAPKLMEVNHTSENVEAPAANQYGS